MYRVEQVAVAKGIRQGADEAGLSVEQTANIAAVLADVISVRDKHFDREMFFAYALSPVLPVE